MYTNQSIDSKYWSERVKDLNYYCSLKYIPEVKRYTNSVYSRLRLLWNKSYVSQSSDYSKIVPFYLYKKFKYPNPLIFLNSYLLKSQIIL